MCRALHFFLKMNDAIVKMIWGTFSSKRNCVKTWSWMGLLALQVKDLLCPPQHIWFPPLTWRCVLSPKTPLWCLSFPESIHPKSASFVGLEYKLTYHDHDHDLIQKYSVFSWWKSRTSSTCCNQKRLNHHLLTYFWWQCRQILWGNSLGYWTLEKVAMLKEVLWSF